MGAPHNSTIVFAETIQFPIGFGVSIRSKTLLIFLQILGCKFQSIYLGCLACRSILKLITRNLLQNRVSVKIYLNN